MPATYRIRIDQAAKIYPFTEHQTQVALRESFAYFTEIANVRFVFVEAAEQYSIVTREIYAGNGIHYRGSCPVGGNQWSIHSGWVSAGHSRNRPDAFWWAPFGDSLNGAKTVSCHEAGHSSLLSWGGAASHCVNPSCTFHLNASGQWCPIHRQRIISKWGAAPSPIPVPTPEPVPMPISIDYTYPAVSIRFSSVGRWDLFPGGFSGNPIRASKREYGPATAKWTIFAPSHGDYAVYLTWPPYSNRGSDVPVAIRVANTLQVWKINQKLRPSFGAFGGADWNFLTDVHVIDPTLPIVVEIGNDCNEWAVADAVGIKRLGEPLPPPSPGPVESFLTLPLRIKLLDGKPAGVELLTSSENLSSLPEGESTDEVDLTLGAEL